MRLTRIGRLTGIALAMAAGVTLMVMARDEIMDIFAFDGGRDAIDARATRRVLVYRLTPEHPVSFAFSRPAAVFRVMAQPVIDPRDWTRRKSWAYGFRVIVRDASGAEISREDVYSRALHPDRVLPFRRPVRVFRTGDLKIALQSDVILDSAPPASTIDILPLPSDPGVRFIDLRVFERLPFIGRMALSEFQRRSPADQAHLAASSAFPAEMLSDAERTALMTNRWRILGPVGIAGRDFQVSVVYEGAFEPGTSEGEE